MNARHPSTCMILTGACIRIDNRNPLPARTVLEEALFGAIVAGAGQAREIEEDRHLALTPQCLWGKEEVECHVTFGCGCGVSEFKELSSERGDCSFRRDRHDNVYRRVGELIN